jgi:chromate transport protein ChrA
MRNLGAEQRFADRLFIVGGALFLLGLAALAIGTEMLVLSYFSVDPTMFWIWQGVWAVATAVIVSMVAKMIKSNTVAKNGDS